MRTISAAVSALAAVAVSAVIVAAAIAGTAVPFWQGGSLTLSEAAALRDRGEAVRLIASGSDPNAVYALRRGVLASDSMTPLEAAVGARRAEMVDLLMLHGASVDAAGWRRLRCEAASSGADDVVGMLDRYKPAGADASCE
jgi:hypothetical protein